jgi:hypothetical protein
MGRTPSGEKKFRERYEAAPELFSEPFAGRVFAPASPRRLIPGNGASVGREVFDFIRFRPTLAESEPRWYRLGAPSAKVDVK